MPDDEKDYLISMALCIATWTEIEDRLFSLFSLSLHTTPEQEAIIFFRTPTLDSRLQLTDEMIGTILPKDQEKSGNHKHHLAKEWAKLAIRVREGLQFRNKLAHWPLFDRWKFAEDTGKLSQRWVETNISYNEFPRKKKASRGIQTDDIIEHLEQAQKLSQDLFKFYNKLFVKPQKLSSPRKTAR